MPMCPSTVHYRSLILCITFCLIAFAAPFAYAQDDKPSAAPGHAHAGSEPIAIACSRKTRRTRRRRKSSA